MRRIRHQSVRWWRSILVVQDTPHRVAWGFSLGWFIGWLPIVGAQIAIGGVLTWLLRGNVVASIAAVWISNPLTLIPMYYFINHLGALFVGEAIRFSELQDHVEHMMGIGAWASVQYIFDTLSGAVSAMFVGGAIVGLVTGIPLYFLIKMVVGAYQARRMERRLRWLGIVEPSQLEPQLEPQPDSTVGSTSRTRTASNQLNTPALSHPKSKT